MLLYIPLLPRHNTPVGKRAGLSHPVKPQTVRPEPKVLAVHLCRLAKVVKGRTWGLGEATQPLILQQVPQTPSMGSCRHALLQGWSVGAVLEQALPGHGQEGQTEG